MRRGARTVVLVAIAVGTLSASHAGAVVYVSSCQPDVMCGEVAWLVNWVLTHRPPLPPTHPYRDAAETGAEAAQTEASERKDAFALEAPPAPTTPPDPVPPLTLPGAHLPDLTPIAAPEQPAPALALPAPAPDLAGAHPAQTASPPAAREVTGAPGLPRNLHAAPAAASQGSPPGPETLALSGRGASSEAKQSPGTASVPPAPAALPGELAAAVAGAGLALLPLLHRLASRDRIFANEMRRRIYALAANPDGVTAAGAARALSLSPTTAAYHLERLRAHGVLGAVHAGNRRIYYVNGSGLDASDRCAREAVARPGAGAILAAVRERPEVTLRQLAARSGMTLSATYWSVGRLERAGLLVTERAPRAIRYRVTRRAAAFSATEGASPPRGPPRPASSPAAG